MDQDQLKETLLAVVRNACLALGGNEKSKENSSEEFCYQMGVDCLASLRDITNYIELDKDLVVSELSNLTLEKDLISILELNKEMKNKVEQNYIYICVDLITLITNSCEKITSEDLEDCELLQRKTQQQACHEAQIKFKQTFISYTLPLEMVLRVACQYLAINKLKNTQKEIDNARNSIQCCLNFFRNLAAIEESTSLQDNTSKHQSKLIELYKEKQIFRLLIDLASDNRKVRDWHIVILEIFYHLFSGINPQDLFSDASTKGPISHSEMKIKERTQKIHIGRHGHWGGTHSMKLGKDSYFTVHGQTPSQMPGPQLPDMGKKKWQKTKIMDDYDKRKMLTSSALQCLKTVASEFLESCGFSNLVSEGKKAIEYDKMIPQHHKYFLYVVRFFLETHLLLSKEQQKKQNLPSDLDACSYLDVVLKSSIMELRGFIFMLKKMREYQEAKSWTELHFSIECFHQMLNVVKEIAESPYEDYNQLAAELLTQIFYEQSTFDMILNFIRDYKTQSLGFLNSLVKMIDLFISLLEDYASQRKNMKINRKVSKGKKKNKKDANSDSENDQEEIEDQIQEKKNQDLENSERIFQFESFQQRFASEKIVEIYCILLETYQELECHSIQHIVNMFNRIAIKCRGGIGAFFKLSTLELFHRILGDLSKNSATEAHLNLKQFIQLCVREFLKFAKLDPLLLASILLPKKSSDFFYSSQDIDKKEKGKKPQELKVRRKFVWEEQVRIVVTALFEDEKKEYLFFVEQVIHAFKKDRKKIEKKWIDNEKDPKFHELILDCNEKIIQTIENEKMRLLLNLLQLSTYYIGKDGKDEKKIGIQLDKSVDVERLRDYQRIIKETIEKPFNPEGRPAKEYLYKKRSIKPKSKAQNAEKPDEQINKHENEKKQEKLNQDSEHDDKSQERQEVQQELNAEHTILMSKAGDVELNTADTEFPEKERQEMESEGNDDDATLINEVEEIQLNTPEMKSPVETQEAQLKFNRDDIIHMNETGCELNIPNIEHSSCIQGPVLGANPANLSRIHRVPIWESYRQQKKSETRGDLQSPADSIKFAFSSNNSNSDETHSDMCKSKEFKTKDSFLDDIDSDEREDFSGTLEFSLDEDYDSDYKENAIETLDGSEFDEGSIDVQARYLEDSDDMEDFAVDEDEAEDEEEEPERENEKQLENCEDSDVEESVDSTKEEHLTSITSLNEDIQTENNSERDFDLSSQDSRFENKVKKSLFIEYEAVEEDDEYMGMGGTDCEDDEDDGESLVDFITNDRPTTQNEYTTARNYWQEKELEQDQAEVTALYKDITTGRLRKRTRGVEGRISIDDDDSFKRKKKNKKMEDSDEENYSAFMRAGKDDINYDERLEDLKFGDITSSQNDQQSKNQSMELFCGIFENEVNDESSKQYEKYGGHLNTFSNNGESSTSWEFNEVVLSSLAEEEKIDGFEKETNIFYSWEAKFKETNKLKSFSPEKRNSLLDISPRKLISFSNLDAKGRPNLATMKPVFQTKLKPALLKPKAFSSEPQANRVEKQKPIKQKKKDYEGMEKLRQVLG